MKILFAGGGSLGPVTPLLAVMDELRRRDSKIEMVFAGTSHGPEGRLVQETGFRFVSFDAPKLRRYFSLRTLVLPFEFLGALIRAGGLLSAEKPDVVVGAGGFTSVPLGIMAKLTGRKVLIHQQDVAASLSNKLLAPFADAITVNFETSLSDFPKRKTVRIGNPVRIEYDATDRERGLKFLGLTGERPVVLAVGGGTGSVFLNELIALATPLWTGFADVVHVTGLEKSDLRLPTLTHPARYKRYDFVGKDIVHLYEAADLVVCRAGTGTMTELAALSKPVILIPIPDSQQEANAAYVVEAGAARMFRELDLTPEQLVTFARELLRKPDEMHRLGKTLHDLFVPGAREAMTEKILELTKK